MEKNRATIAKQDVSLLSLLRSAKFSAFLSLEEDDAPAGGSKWVGMEQRNTTMENHWHPNAAQNRKRKYNRVEN